MVSNYIYGAHAILLTYDITNFQVSACAKTDIHVHSLGAGCQCMTMKLSSAPDDQSFQDLEDWMSLVQKVYTQADMPYLAILANKADLTHMRTVRPAQHAEFADLHKMHR